MKLQLISLFLLATIASADVTTGLKAHYTLAGTLSDEKGNPDLVNQGASLTADKDGNANSAYQLVEDNDVFIVPNSAFNGVVDYALSIWVRADHISKPESTLFSVANQYSAYLNLVTVLQTQLWLSSEKSGWTFSRYNYGSNLFTGNWQHIVLTRDSANSKLYIYVDGALFFEYDNTTYEDGKPLLVEGFVIGNEQNGSLNSGFYSMYQFHGALQDFRVYDRYLSQEDVTELYTGVPPVDPVNPQDCIDALAILEPGTITEDLTFPLNEAENEYYHNYVINFNDFVYTDGCFDSQLWIGTEKVTYEIVDNSITVSFAWKDAVANGCTQVTDTQQQCQFQLLIFWDNVLQHKKLFTSTINTPDLTDLTAEIKLDVTNDEDEDLKSFDQSIESELKFCTDITCSAYADTAEFIRNTDVYVEFKVLTPGYNNYYPIHKLFKLNDFQVSIENQAAIDLWNEQGRIIYHFRPPFASEQITLAVGVSLSKTSPVTRRRLQVSGQEPSFEEQKDNVGKYLKIAVVDVETADQKGGNNNEVVGEVKEESDNTMVYIGLAALGVVLVLGLSLVVVCYKMKMASKNAQPQAQKQTELADNQSEIKVTLQ